MTPSYALGLVFILLVTVIWSLASILVQYLYTDQHFDSPFLLTYIGTSLFILFLPTRLLWERRHKCCGQKGGDEGSSSIEIIPWNHQLDGSYQPISQQGSDTEVEDNQQQQAEDYEEQADVVEMGQTHRLLSHSQHLSIALKIAPMWFLANWTYNASLEFTSITSSTVLASTGSLFTLLFAVLCGDEKFTILKLVGVLCGVNGSIFMAWNDIPSGNATNVTNATDVFLSLGNNNSSTAFLPEEGVALDKTAHPLTPHGHGIDSPGLLGDFLGLLSAFGYGAYTVMVRVWCPKDENSYSMQLMLGYIGLINATLLSPLAMYTFINNNAGSSTESHLTWFIFGFLVVKGLLDNVVSDYLWARAVVLTSATVATVGLGFTIPLAFVSDLILGHRGVASIQSGIGAASVLLGFVLVNSQANTEQTNDDEDPDNTDDGGHEDDDHLSLQ